MSRLSNWTILTLAFTGAMLGPLSQSSALAALPNRAELSRPWLKTGENMNTENFGKILGLLQETSYTQNLLSEVTRKLGVNSPEELMTIVHPARFDDHSTMGSFRSDGCKPEIHIKTGIPLLEAFQTIVHELSHFTQIDPHWAKADVLGYENADDFAMRLVLAPGGELEAFTTEAKASLALRERTGLYTMDPLLNFFDDDGTLNDREGLISHILDNQGYRKSLGKQFAEITRHQYENARSRGDRNRMQAIRQKFPQVFSEGAGR